MRGFDDREKIFLSSMQPIIPSLVLQFFFVEKRERKNNNNDLIFFNLVDFSFRGKFKGGLGVVIAPSPKKNLNHCHPKKKKGPLFYVAVHPKEIF